LRKQGHDVRLIAAQFVKAFVKSNKNDFVDAEAIAEAVERKNMRFVPIKTDDQLDLQAIHRVRDRLISRRTAVINQLRAFLLERGLVFAKTPGKLRAALPDILENAALELTAQMRNLLDLLWNEWKTVEDQIKGLSLELERISAADPGCTRIRQIPGIGPIVAAGKSKSAGSTRSAPATTAIARSRAFCSARPVPASEVAAAHSLPFTSRARFRIADNSPRKEGASLS
jgi:transposase